ncbi:xylulose kinase [Frankia sp. CNm7]|uniref:Xylulose kinase n=1 Tax=Frankia nepalensis TaxID=1836974 RepID=A0A937RET8_9ACTN|nr:FGGY family carbohydrate kinase [Frankia nepalensis]MBL7500320.1 xylulose kinase [Frankia nepalensis]MBL7508542.1 xylulose kinase [Frankia nepalensis]MBL7520417.1 xylulose kinase [Frankia nepalensis]MBL7627670.1 xylulose kinase [Frankia nepalensis]
MTLVAGVDSSTQSTKIVICDAADGRIVRSAAAPHPEGTEVDPAAWWAALRSAASGGLLDGVAALAVAGQQHGMVVLDDAGRTVRPALLWNDVRSADDADDLVAELGAERWATATGSVPTASFTVTKLRWLARQEPANAARARSVLLPHDWLTWRLAGGGPAGGGPGDPDGGRPDVSRTTDRGDASGTGYWSPATGGYLPDLVETALGHPVELPRVAGPREVVGEAARLAPPGTLLAPGTGDNMAAALGICPSPGDVVVSVGTSGTIFATTEHPTHDPDGLVAGFADATGRFLPLVCTLNAARVLTTVADLLGVSPAGFDALALAASPGAGGLTLLPFLDGERTPNLPRARGLLAGLTRGNLSRENLARAAVEGVLCGLAVGVDALRRHGVEVRRALLVGGGARSRAIRAVAPAVLGLPVALPDPGTEWVARGAARQAAWALSGAAEPPDWPVSADLVAAEPDPLARAAFLEVLDGALPLLRR